MKPIDEEMEAATGSRSRKVNVQDFNDWEESKIDKAQSQNLKKTKATILKSKKKK